MTEWENDEISYRNQESINRMGTEERGKVDDIEAMTTKETKELLTKIDGETNGIENENEAEQGKVDRIEAKIEGETNGIENEEKRMEMGAETWTETKATEDEDEQVYGRFVIENDSMMGGDEHEIEAGSGMKRLKAETKGENETEAEMKGCLRMKRAGLESELRKEEAEIESELRNQKAEIESELRKKEAEINSEHRKEEAEIKSELTNQEAEIESLQRKEMAEMGELETQEAEIESEQRKKKAEIENELRKEMAEIEEKGKIGEVCANVVDHTAKFRLISSAMDYPSNEDTNDPIQNDFVNSTNRNNMLSLNNNVNCGNSATHDCNLIAENRTNSSITNSRGYHRVNSNEGVHKPSKNAILTEVCIINSGNANNIPSVCRCIMLSTDGRRVPLSTALRPSTQENCLTANHNCASAPVQNCIDGCIILSDEDEREIETRRCEENEERTFDGDGDESIESSSREILEDFTPRSLSAIEIENAARHRKQSTRRLSRNSTSEMQMRLKKESGREQEFLTREQRKCRRQVACQMRQQSGVEDRQKQRCTKLQQQTLDNLRQLECDMQQQQRVVDQQWAGFEMQQQQRLKDQRQPRKEMAQHSLALKTAKIEKDREPQPVGVSLPIVGKQELNEADANHANSESETNNKNDGEVRKVKGNANGEGEKQNDCKDDILYNMQLQSALNGNKQRKGTRRDIEISDVNNIVPRENKQKNNSKHDAISVEQGHQLEIGEADCLASTTLTNGSTANRKPETKSRNVSKPDLELPTLSRLFDPCLLYPVLDSLCASNDSDLIGNKSASDSSPSIRPSESSCSSCPHDESEDVVSYVASTKNSIAKRIFGQLNPDSLDAAEQVSKR